MQHAKEIGGGFELRVNVTLRYLTYLPSLRLENGQNRRKPRYNGLQY